MALPSSAAVTLSDVKEHLNQTLDVDDALIERKIMAAQEHLENLLGFALDAEYPTTGSVTYPATVPASIKECICQLVAHWFENREATLVGVSAQQLPFSVWDIVNAHRRWSFGEEAPVV